MKNGRREGGSALWTVLVFVVLLAGIVAATYPVYTRQREELKAAKVDIDSARDKIDALSLRPTNEELEIAKSRLQDVRGQLESTAAKLAETAAALDVQKRRVDELDAHVNAAEAELQHLKPEEERLRVLCEELTTRGEELAKQVKTLTVKYENARRAASDKADILDQLDSSTTQVAELEQNLADEQKKLAASSQACADLEAQLAACKAAIAEKDELLSALRKELSDIPIAPLPEELAEQKYREYLGKVAEHPDREGRVAMLFRAKLALTGSEYEGKADSAWRREIKRKQEDVDRAARIVYEDVVTKMRLHPDAHDANVNLLEEAFEKIKESKYEKVMQQLIDREHELKAVGR
jgi:peptidoglycan hydrolase CwlO-like protein